MRIVTLLLITLLSTSCISLNGTMSKESVTLSEIRTVIEKEKLQTGNQISNLSILNSSKTSASGFVELQKRDGSIQDYFFEAEIANDTIKLIYFQPYEP